MLQAVGDPLIDSVVSENIPILTADEKFNETVYSIARRVEAVLTSEPLPSPSPLQKLLLLRVSCGLGMHINL